MNKVLIGSTALVHHFPDLGREPKDLDYALISKEYKKEGEDSMVIPLVCNNSTTEVASPGLLLTLKISHIFWNRLGERNWEKHMWDIQFLLSKGVTYDWDLVLQLKEFWTDHYNGLYRSNLKQSSEEFFTNAIDCPIPHDTIHELLNPEPVYRTILKGEVELDETKYHALGLDRKLQLFQEEVMVMAYERWGSLYYKDAYYRMLKKFIRGHVPMFAFQDLLLNWYKVDRPPYNFIEKINKFI